MEVLLIFPRLNPGVWGGYCDLPLGIVNLATYLRRAGVSCSVLDTTLLTTWDEFDAALNNYSPDVVGLSFSSPMAHLGFEAARRVKQCWPGVTTVAGGPHPTISPEETLRHEAIDAVIVGEGEIAFRRFFTQVRALSAKLTRLGRITELGGQPA